MDYVTFVRAPDFNGEPIVFSGSTETDKAYAKTFWQSVELSPHIESRLVSANEVSQRLKSAPPVGQRRPNKSYGQQNFSSSCNTGAFGHANNSNSAPADINEIRRIEQFAYFREADLQRLKEMRHRRIQMENKIGRTSKFKSHKNSKELINSDEKSTPAAAETIVRTNNNDEVLDTIRQIDKFEATLSSATQ